MGVGTIGSESIRRINGKWLRFSNPEQTYVATSYNGDWKTLIVIYKGRYSNYTNGQHNVDLCGTETYAATHKGFTVRPFTNDIENFIFNDGETKVGVALRPGNLFNVIHMLATTYDGKFFRGYVDGILKDTSDEYDNFDFNNGRSITIGKAYNSLSARYFDGDIYLFALFGDAKSDDFIKKIYNSWKNGMSWSKMRKKYKDDSCVLWYDGDSIDEANGIWKDASVQRNDGAIYRATVVKDVGEITGENVGVI